jgi:hypothetical protein
MKWEEIRISYPQQWLLIEAIDAHSHADRRVLGDLSVVHSYQNSAQALQHYSRLHHEDPNRELYVFHTSRDLLDITERQWLGVRVAG